MILPTSMHKSNGLHTVKYMLWITGQRPASLYVPHHARSFFPVMGSDPIGEVLCIVKQSQKKLNITVEVLEMVMEYPFVICSSSSIIFISSSWINQTFNSNSIFSVQFEPVPVNRWSLPDLDITIWSDRYVSNRDSQDQEYIRFYRGNYYWNVNYVEEKKYKDHNRIK